MKKLQSFEDYIKENYDSSDSMNEGRFQTLAMAALMGISALAAKPAMAGDRGKKINHMTKVVKSDAEKEKLMKRGWSVDSTTVETLIDTIQNDAELINIKLDLGQHFESGSWTLSEESKHDIDSLMENISLDKYTITDMRVESSTDKTPISSRMTQKTGIKNNKELSEHRNNAVIEYLKEKGYVSPENEVGSKVLFEQGSKDDVTARYVTLIVTGIRVEVNSVTSQTTDTTYYMSRDYETGGSNIKKGDYKVKVKDQKFKKVDKSKLKAYACPRNH